MKLPKIEPVRIYLSVKLVDVCNDIMTADNAKLHEVYTINSEDKSLEIATTHGNRLPINVVPKKETTVCDQQRS